MEWRDWKETARDTVRQIRRDNVPIVSAGVAFYAVLGVIPAAIMAVTLYGLFTEPIEAERQIERLLDVLPPDAASVVADQMRPIASSASGFLTVGFVASALGLLWTASNATSSTIHAVVIAYDGEDEEPRWAARLAAIGVTITALILLAVVLAMITVLPAWASRVGSAAIALSLRWFALLVIVFFVALLLYRYAPPRDPPGWGSGVPGAALAAIAWLAVSFGFSVYVENFGRYNQTYGALGGGIILMMWFFLSAMAVLVGAELNAVIEQRSNSSE